MQHMMPPNVIQLRGRPRTNTERQREFRERNPNYYRDLKRRERAASRAGGKLLAARLAMQAAQAAFLQRALLCLPAPVQTLDLPGVNAIPTREQMLAMQAERAAA